MLQIEIHCLDLDLAFGVDLDLDSDLSLEFDSTSGIYFERRFKLNVHSDY